jgi:hypothetical protein
MPLSGRARWRSVIGGCGGVLGRGGGSVAVEVVVAADRAEVEDRFGSVEAQPDTATHELHPLPRPAHHRLNAASHRQAGPPRPPAVLTHRNGLST